MPQTQTNNVHIFGIRHHGPGSAKSLLKALHELQPDCILVEGPPDASTVLSLMAHQQMQPPVALLVYATDEPQKAVYYPFALFSPEWQALQYGLAKNLPVRFMDLPQANRMALEKDFLEKLLAETEPKDPLDQEQATESEAQSPEESLEQAHVDPLGWLAKAAGYEDGERWWEQMVEHRQDGADLFEAILEAMTALREELPPKDDPLEAYREAYMRESIRAALKENYERIAVVCGAWHGPALKNLGEAKEDAALLKNLAKVKVQTTWVPWTYGRLSYHSGYGAGIESPGWYHHLWTTRHNTIINWVIRVARLLRGEDLDASSASVIETVRLAEALASMRGRALPDISDLNEAVLAVLCNGNETPLTLIHNKLIVGETLGQVPDETPMVPLQQDLLREQKRLRLPAEATQRVLDLDLRKPSDLERSLLLHRLELLNIHWGFPEKVSGKSGTFHEMWRIQWRPELAIQIIEKAIWGTTVLDAAAALVKDTAANAPDLPTLTNLLDRTLLAELPEATAFLMEKLQAQAAVASDVGHLLEALPPLANVLRYGNVRKTDTGIVEHVVSGLVVRVCIGLPGACSSLDDAAAKLMYDRVLKFNGAISLLQNAEYLVEWHAVLQQLAHQEGLHGLLAGRANRLLLDADVFKAEEAARQMSLALSRAVEPQHAADWIEGFIVGSGLVLIHNEQLWQVVDEWVTQLPADAFTQTVPLLRRTFATFSAPERQQMGERVRRGTGYSVFDKNQPLELNTERGESVLPLLAKLLGLNLPENINS